MKSCDPNAVAKNFADAALVAIDLLPALVYRGRGWLKVLRASNYLFEMEREACRISSSHDDFMWPLSLNICQTSSGGARTYVPGGRRDRKRGIAH